MSRASLAAGSLLILAAAAEAQLEYPGCSALQPAEFRKVQVSATGISGAIKFTIARDGRIIVAAQNGQINIIDPKTSAVADAGRLTDLGNSIWGVAGVALDPDFVANGRIFVYCTRPVATDSAVSAIRRITLRDGKVDQATQKVLLEWPVNRQGIDHSGGGMGFDPAGNLYVATGDNSNWTLNYGSISEADFKLNALRSAANTNDLRGKVIRIKPKALEDAGAAPAPGPGQTYDIPAGNLFAAGTEGTRPEIYTMGHRNPFSLTLDPLTGWLFVADLGAEASTASTTKGPAAMDEFNLVREAGNYGWPMFAGPNVPYNKFDYVANQTGPLFDTANPINDSKFNTGMQKLPAPRRSLVAYSKDGKHTDWTGFEKAAMVCLSGPVYRYQGDNPSAYKLPPHLDGKWIVADYRQGWFKAISFDAAGTKAVDVQPLFANLSLVSAIDLKLGPDGALYVLEQSRSLSRIEYTGTCKPSVGIAAGGRRDGRRLPDRLAGGQRHLELPAGMRGFAVFDVQGRRVHTHLRKDAAFAATVPLPDLGFGVLRIRWE